MVARRRCWTLTSTGTGERTAAAVVEEAVAVVARALTAEDVEVDPVRRVKVATIVVTGRRVLTASVVTVEIAASVVSAETGLRAREEKDRRAARPDRSAVAALVAAGVAASAARSKRRPRSTTTTTSRRWRLPKRPPLAGWRSLTANLTEHSVSHGVFRPAPPAPSPETSLLRKQLQKKQNKHICRRKKKRKNEPHYKKLDPSPNLCACVCKFHSTKTTR